MKMFWSAVIVAGAIMAVSAVILDGYQKTVDAAFVGSGAKPDAEASLRGGPKS